MESLLYGDVSVMIHRGKIGHMKNALEGVLNIAIFTTPTSSFFI